MATQVVTVDSIDFPVVVYRNARVVTTELLAQAFGTDPDRIRRNHNRNIDRFEDGKHFFKLIGVELQDFVKVFKAGTNPSKVRNLILWTERGAARHAKMLETDQAWEVFEKLEDAYFLPPVERPVQYALKDLRSKKTLPGGLTLDQVEAIKTLVKARVEALPSEYQGGAAITCWSALKTKFGVTYKAIPPHLFGEALSLVARLDLRGATALPAPEPATPRYSFPLSNWQPDNRAGATAWYTYPEHVKLMELGAQLDKLLHQLKFDGHDVTGPMMEYRGMLHLLHWKLVAMRDLFASIERYGLNVNMSQAH